MRLTINSGNNMSFLFSSFNNSYSGFNMGNSGMNFGMSNILADYTSIKNGSYGKLMKAYYGKSNSHVEDVVQKPTGASKDDAKTNAELRSSAEALKNSVDELMQTGSKSVFEKKEMEVKAEDGTVQTVTDYDKDAIYKAVSKFTDSYNQMIKSAGNSENKSVLSMGTSMVTSTIANQKMLGKIGITIGEDNTLSIDKDAFKKADMKTVESMFGKRGSYAYGIQTKASYIDMYAKNDAAKASGLYGKNASYNSSALGNGFNYSSWM